MTANGGQADGWLSERRHALLLEPAWVAEHEADSLRAGLERVVGRRAPCGRRCWQRCHSGGGRTAKAGESLIRTTHNAFFPTCAGTTYKA